MSNLTIHIDDLDKVKKKLRGRGRQPTQAGEMNKTEKAYSVYLDSLKAAGEIKQWWWDAITLKWAKDTRYRADFMVLSKDDRIELHETKGFMEDDAWVKLKTVSALLPFRVLLVKRSKGGNWDITEVEMA